MIDKIKIFCRINFDNLQIETYLRWFSFTKLVSKCFDINSNSLRSQLFSLLIKLPMNLSFFSCNFSFYGFFGWDGLARTRLRMSIVSWSPGTFLCMIYFTPLRSSILKPYLNCCALREKIDTLSQEFLNTTK